MFRFRVRVGWLAAALAFALAGCGGTSHSTTVQGLPTNLNLQLVVSGLSSPLGLEHPDDGSNRLFVVEQGGKIKVISGGAVLPQPFLDISSKVTTGGEMGLLGVAFHPNFAQAPKFYVNYVRTNTSGQIQSVIAEFTVLASNSNLADLASERDLLIVDQVANFPNHKAGQLAFGADGFLYFGLGDGGSGGDPFGHGQNTNILLGKLLRINVDATSPGLQFAIPPDNPFVSGGGLPEIYAYGLRNPWRFSFDRPTGRLFLADVGQDSFEEIDLIQKGGNYGWNIMEGMHCFNPPSGCNMTGLILPIAEYSHAEGNAVIGGYVYHGTRIQGLQNVYLLGDLGTGKIWALQETSPNVWQRTLLVTTGKTISSFGQDANGELYLVDLTGNVFQLAGQ